MSDTIRRLLSLRLPFFEDDGGRTVSPFYAVEIRSADGCAAAEPLHGRRYLSNEAPILPLANCDRSDRCRCTYRHRDDRRRGPRRCTESGGPPAGIPAPAHVQQRCVRGRRAEDRDPEEVMDILEDTYYDYFIAKKSDPEVPPT